MKDAASPDWNDVRYLLAVARAGTLSGAARALGVRHTTVGRRLQAFEKSLGVSLVVRQPGGVELTPLGRRLVPFGEDLERAMSGLQAAATSAKQRVRVALPSGIGSFFAARIPAFAAAHPELALDLIGGSRPADLRRGEAELALRVGEVADDTLTGRRLCMAGWSLYASPSYLDRHAAPGEPHQLAGHDLVGFAGNLAHVPGAKWIEKHGSGATVVLRLAELTEMLDATVGGAGLAVLPCMLAEVEPRVQRLTRKVIGSQPLSIVYRREVGKEAGVRAVIGFVSSVVKDHAAVIRGEYDWRDRAA